MPSISSADVHTMIFHRLYPEDKVLLSEEIVPPASDPNLAKFFARHIVKAYNDSDTQAGEFLNTSNESAQLCFGPLQDPTTLVPNSRTLAEKLRTIINSKVSIKEGNLAFCLYRSDGGTESRLAILKFDPGEVLLPREEKGAVGTYITFDYRADTVPSLNERLQKCAFINRFSPDSTRHMWVLDRQNRDDIRAVANFFIGDFLQARLALDDRRRTLLFYEASINAYNEVAPYLNPDQDRLLRQARMSALRTKHVPIADWLGSLPIPLQLRERFRNVLLSTVEFPDFSPDHGLVIKLLKRRIYIGDHELRIEFKPEYEDDIIKRKVPIIRNGTPVGWQITIETQWLNEYSNERSRPK